MGLFGRRRAEAPDTGVGADEPDADLGARPADSPDGSAGETSGGSAGGSVGEPADAQPESTFSRLRGPFDESEDHGPEPRLDLGALRIAAAPGLGVRLEVDEASQTIIGAQLELSGSAVQVQAYAAPRTQGIWPEIRTEIADSLAAQGARTEIVDGMLGRELRVRLANGQAMRFLGVDGPRWFLRAVLSGPAATDDAAAAPLVELVRRTVVVRGTDAMAPRELLPLRLPAQPDTGDAPDPVAPEGGPAAHVEDLKPFERGPEITEVR